jgi:hypothetical protein
MIFPCPARREAGATLIEILVAAALVACFFVTIFEVNAFCLRYIDASKECVNAVQGVQDRIEGLRNLDFNNLISPTYMTTAQPAPTGTPAAPRPVSLNYPSNTSDFAARVTEVVTISGYPSGTPLPGGTPSITYTRAPGSQVTPTFSPSPAPDFSSMTMVKVKVQYTWNAVLGRRQQSEETETLISAGTKK